MNLFTARLTGKMLSTDAFERTMSEMQARVKRWRQIEKSPELAEYLELKKIVESSDFKEKKHLLQNRKYDETDEGRKMTMYNRLRNICRTGFCINIFVNYVKASKETTSRVQSVWEKF